MPSRQPRRRRSLEPRARNISDVLYPTLDLHGKTESEANRSVRAWLERIQSSGEPVGRVITGRGLHSVGLPVLPKSVESLLEQLKGTIVASYDREPGGGAYTVRLLRAVKPYSRPTRTLPSVKPDVIRRAEEALAELGIDPTPAMVEAEVRRILAKQDLENS